MPRPIAGTLIVLSPIVILLLAALFAALIRGKRRRWTADAVAGTSVFLLVHAGFFAAPLLFVNDLRGLALWLTAPVSIAITLFTLATMKRMHMFDRRSPLINKVIPAILLLAYWAPLAGVSLSH